MKFPMIDELKHKGFLQSDRANQVFKVLDGGGKLWLTKASIGRGWYRRCWYELAIVRDNAKVFEQKFTYWDDVIDFIDERSETEKSA